MSDSSMVAFVAIKKYGALRGGGASFAYLPNTEVSLPEGWEWNRPNGTQDTMDVSGVAESMRMVSLDVVCRVMCDGTGIEW